MRVLYSYASLKQNLKTLLARTADSIIMVQKRLRNMTLINDIDWESWQPEQVATLLFVIVEENILLIRKKRGLGAGKINGPGGRIEKGESPMECAIRETQEELCITPLKVEARGQLFFYASDAIPHIHGYIFTAAGFEGEPRETDEAIPLWTPLSEIPYDEMWEDDKLWLPEVISGNSVNGWFTFAGETLLDHKIEINS